MISHSSMQEDQGMVPLVEWLGCFHREHREAWRRAGCCAHHSPTGRILRITLALHGNEGVWHLFSVYGPTFQATQLDKTRFWRELGRSWNHIPSRDIAYILGDFNSRVGSRQQPGYPHEVLGLHCVGPPQWQW